MPHIIVKLWPGKSEQQKQRLADAITQNVMDIIGSGENSISVGIEDVPAEEWADAVYKPDIVEKPDTIYKKPGYTM
jgi:4-oxalocrotonate tautomerase